MSIIKNVGSSYTINTINHDDPIILDSNIVIIRGNLTVMGNTETITTSNTIISNSEIVLNGGTVGSPVLDAALVVERGTSPDVKVKWNETDDVWQITNDGITYYNIVATTTGNTRLVDDALPQLGANLNTANYTITNYDGDNVYIDPTQNLQLDGNIQLKKFESTPDIVSNYNILSASNVSTGGTGLFVTNDEGVVNQELISKSRAIVYSIIF